MIIKFLLLSSSCIVFLRYLSLLVKSMNELLKTKSDDMDIKATVVSIVPHVTGDVQPILQYDMDGVVKKYICHYYCSPDKYSIGDEVTLKFSKEDGLAYDKEDLIKGLLLRLIATIIMMCAVLFFTCDLFN